MTDLSLWVGIIGNVTWMLLFLAHAHTYYRMARNTLTENRSDEEFESLQYIGVLLGSVIWTNYGIIKPNSILISTVNGVGIVIETIYLILFYIYAPPNVKGKTVRRLVSNVVYVGAFVSFVEIFTDGETRIYCIGYMGAAFNIVMYISSLFGGLLTVRRQECLPFLLPLFCFFNGGIWTFYAFLVQDYFLGVPNALGFIFATVQLLVYSKWRYSNERESLLA